MWVGLGDVAAAAGITPQPLRFIIARPGSTWRGAALVVRRAPSLAGGGSTGKQYQIQIESLPSDLQARFNEQRALASRPVLQFADRRSAKNEWLHLILSPALAHPPRSAERRAAIDAILARPLTDRRGPPAKRM